jgi:multiple sugar transport system ATP-binding protein
MAMADRIAVMNHGVVEQVGSPREIYDKPSSVFVADFIGSPPMNLLTFRSSLEAGAQCVKFGDSEIRVPTVNESLGERDLVLGIRPEAVQFSDSSNFRASVFGAEYLGTTQIVTVTTEHGALRARVPSDVNVRIGDSIGLAFRPEKLSLFDKSSGRAISTALTAGPAHV